MSVSILAMIGPWQLAIIAGVVLLFFGNRIPGMARSLGSGIVEFRKGLKGEDDDDKALGDGASAGGSTGDKASEKKEEKV